MKIVLGLIAFAALGFGLFAGPEYGNSSAAPKLTPCECCGADCDCETCTCTAGGCAACVECAS